MYNVESKKKKIIYNISPEETTISNLCPAIHFSFFFFFYFLF